MSTIASGISPDNINISPASFNYPSPRIGKDDDSTFNEALNMKVNTLKASVSEPLKAGGVQDLVKSFVLEVNEKDQIAQEMRTAVLTGESTNLHQTMIASQEASLSFTLMLEMRNKVMETYQELMRLQL